MIPSAWPPSLPRRVYGRRQPGQSGNPEGEYGIRTYNGFNGWKTKQWQKGHSGNPKGLASRSSIAVSVLLSVDQLVSRQFRLRRKSNEPQQ